MKWLKITSIVLVVTVLTIFALMGLLYATRGTPTSTVRAFGDPAGPPASTDSTFLRTMQVLTQTELFDGNNVEMLNDGDGTYPRLYADFHNAQHSITVQLYYCKPGIVADSFKTILSERARAGVKVLMLFDAFGSQSLKDEYLDSLKAAGVRVAHFRPVTWHTLHKAQNRSHVRVIVIDEQIGYTGGFGLADYWLGDGHSEEHWRDTNVRFMGPSVLQLQAAFSIAWAEATGQLLTGRFLFGSEHPQDTTHKQVAGLMYAQSTLGSTAAERFIALTIASARRTLYITNAYFVPDDDQMRLLEMAARRGVDVRVLTAGKKTDVRTVRHAGHAHYGPLLAAGVKIYEYNPTMLHSKTLVADGIWGTIGTMNFDNRSIAFNDEANLLVHDSAFGAVLDRQFMDDLRFSTSYTMQMLKRRSFFERVLDAGANRFARLL